jgi:hypothetical protein
MATVALLPCGDKKIEDLLYKAKQILAEGECDCDCRNCPGLFVCFDPDLPPYGMLKEFIRHNEKLPVEDDLYNNQVNRENLNALADEA